MQLAVSCLADICCVVVLVIRSAGSARAVLEVLVPLTLLEALPHSQTT